MKRNDSHQVVADWGTYLEHCHGRLQALFSGSIPESLLPYTCEELEEALNAVAKYHFDRGDVAAEALIKRSFGPLALYTKDATALDTFAAKLAMPGLPEAIIAAMKRSQQHWRTTHPIV